MSNDLRSRARVKNERVWNTPNFALSKFQLWPVFEAVVVKIIGEWDVMQMATTSRWCDGDEFYERAKIMDDALANFSKRWIDEKMVDASEITDFLVDSMEDRFNAELEDDTASSVARLLVKLFEEACSNTTTGMRHILGEQMFEEIRKRDTGFNVRLETPSTKVLAEASALRDDDDDESDASNHEDKPDVCLSAPVQVVSATSIQRVVDEDGFELVKPKLRRSGRVAQQYAIAPVVSNHPDDMQVDE